MIMHAPRIAMEILVITCIVVIDTGCVLWS